MKTNDELEKEIDELKIRLEKLVSILEVNQVGPFAPSKSGRADYEGIVAEDLRVARLRK